MSVSITMTFNDLAAATAFLTGRTTTEAPRPSQPVYAASPPTAAQTSAAEPAAPLTFENLVSALQAYSKRQGVTRDDFAALMKKFGVAKVPELKGKPESWPEIIAAVA